MRFSSFLFMSILLGAVGVPQAIAQSPLTIELEDVPIRNQVIEAGDMRVVVTAYDPKEDTNLEQDNLSYEIYVGDELKAQIQDEVWWFGRVALQNLDQDATPEVLVNTYTGGAHCCTIWKLYSWQRDRLHYTQTYPLDGYGGVFEDLDGDGYTEFMAVDNRFLYAFSSYAGSYPPLIILSFRGGSLIDVTRQFPDKQRSHAYGMYQSIQTGQGFEANGVLAGYVAQKILLGEYQQGWDYMLAHYDTEDTWGLDVLNNRGESIYTYPDFPAALSAFLFDTGYLDNNGLPNANFDLARTIVEQASLLSW